jgi:hypothetical protein
MTALAARLSLLMAPVCLLGSLACARSAQPDATPPPTRTPRASTPDNGTPGPNAQRLAEECPPESRDDCVAGMLSLLRSPADIGRVALCVDRGGGWLARQEKDVAPELELPFDARVGDRCPGAPPYAIRGIYVQESPR